MKLLLISVKNAFPSGGIAVWTNRFLSQCTERGIDCHLVNTEIIGKRHQTGKRCIWDELVRTLRIYRDLKKQLKSYDFDAVYLNTSCGNYGLFRDVWLGYLIHKKDIPLITHYHCEIPYWVKCKTSVCTLGKLAAISRHNLVLCQNSQNFLQEHYNITASKVPNFVHSSLVRTTPKPIEGPIQHAIFVGNITEHKGATELFAIAQQMPHIQFTLIGQVNHTVSSWKTLDNLTLTGQLPHEQVMQCLDEADVFLFPSHTEGCSMALMEAMARGLPAIATDTGANSEMLAHGGGIVVALHDVEAMVDALHQLDAPSIRQTMSQRAIQCIRQNYTDKNVDTLFNLIQLA